MYIEVLRVVDVPVRALLNPLDHSGFQIEHDGARDVSGVVGLVEEDILAIAALGREGLEVAVAVDAVFEAELLPELRPDAVAALAGLEGDDFAITILEVSIRFSLR
jgi:hypothetical protein